MKQIKKLLIGATVALTLVLTGAIANQADACPCSGQKQVSAKKKSGVCKAPRAPNKTTKQKQPKAKKGKRS